MLSAPDDAMHVPLELKSTNVADLNRQFKISGNFSPINIQYPQKDSERTNNAQFSPAVVCENVYALMSGCIPEANRPVIATGSNETTIWGKPDRDRQDK